MRIVRDPETCSGKYLIEGTRLIVVELLKSLPEYESWAEFVSEYPSLSVYSEDSFLKALVEVFGERHREKILFCLREREKRACTDLVRILSLRESRAKNRELMRLLRMLLTDKPIKEGSIEYKWLKRYENLLMEKGSKTSSQKLTGAILSDVLGVPRHKLVKSRLVMAP